MYKIMYWEQGEEFQEGDYETQQEAEERFEYLCNNKQELGEATYLELTDEYLNEIKTFSFLETGL